MKFRHAVSFIVFAAMIVFAVVRIGALGVAAGPPADRIDLSMEVEDINSLVVGSNVLLRGVPVGKVTGFDTSVGGATIHFYIGGRYQVPVDSDVRLENLSALGESYIGFVPRTGAGPMLQDGQRIATEAIIAPPSVSELTTSVVRVLTQLDPGALQRVVDEADAALPDTNSVLPNLTRTSRLLQHRASHMDYKGREVLDNFQMLLQNAGWVGPLLGDLAPGIQEVGKALQLVVSGFEYLVYQYGAPYSVVSLNNLLARIQKLLDDNGADLKVLGEAFLPKLKGIAGALLNFDPSQILANILEGVPEDGAITLRVAVPGG